MAAIFNAWASSSSSSEPLLSTSMLSNASSAVVTFPPALNNPLANENFSDGARTLSNSVKALSSPPSRIGRNPNRENFTLIELNVLFQKGVLSSTSTSTSRPSASSARAISKPAMVREKNSLLFDLSTGLVVKADCIEVSESPGSESVSTAEAFLLPFLPNFSLHHNLIELVTFRFIRVTSGSASNAVLAPPITPCNKSLSNLSRCNFVCSSRPSRS
mmetsp:Transcript_22630/g.37270  ORF Transcript_22630/g.37270 Transcript_22630/m.37270 type:complete len:217 (-) Transcript_22630:385-1035(-)